VEAPLRMRTDWEKTLRERLIDGDETALEELYDQFSPLVYGLAVRVTGDRAAAEDITQDVFVHMWERPAAFEPAKGTMRAWLGTMAHRRAVDWVRRGEVRRRHLHHEAAEPRPAPNIEEAAIASAVAKIVHTALDELPPGQREAIHLAYFAGKTHREVAEKLGIPLGTAKSRIWVGLRTMASRLEAEGIVGP
jgi:RNA polymerase sigma factor (sigma-70 family)